VNPDRLIVLVLFAACVLMGLGWYLDHVSLAKQVAEWRWALNLVDPIRIEAELKPEDVMPNPHK
jgi:hypothetical protein